jgi:hypothetical protein
MTTDQGDQVYHEKCFTLITENKLPGFVVGC